LNNYKKILIAAFSGALMLSPVSGRVFRVTGGVAGQLNTVGLPWDSAYQTTMTVNGRKRLVHVYSARYTEPVVEQLKNQFEFQGAEVSLWPTPSGATGIAKWPDHEARFIVLSPKSQPNHIIFVFYPEEGAAQEVPRFPVPVYERGQVKNTVMDDDTGVFMATIETPDSSTQIHSFYQNVLSGSGWNLVLPANVKNGTVSGMAIYQKKKKICYVQATHHSGASNILTLLVKGEKL
jgi:hypothetical protein